MIIKGWCDRKDMCVISKAREHIDVSTAMEMIEASKIGPVEGYIRRPGGTILKYNRYRDGRIVIKQI